MSSGIVAKVWNIKGESITKGAKEQISDSISYILNDEKTEIKLDINTLDQLTRECKYVENDLKTFSGAYVGVHNVISSDIATAVGEMMNVKKFFGKTSGRAALHMMISLPEEESDVANAPRLMQLCQDVLKELFPDNQAIFAVHTNTDNLHIHIIVNSVGLNGKKIHQDNKYIKERLQPCVNKYA
ncbi:relaxase/mobilization nuclease domain-containing protein, partial [Waltera acetigignens]